MKRIRLPRFLEMTDMKRNTFDRYRHRAEDPLPCIKIGGCVYVDMDKYPKWEERENLKANKY